MKRAGAAIVFAAMVWGGQLAAQTADPADHAGAYRCTDLASVGYHYNEARDEWQQVNFYLETTMVRLDLLETYDVESLFTPGEMQPHARYGMKTRTEGSSEYACWSFQGEDTLEVNEYGWMRCRSLNTVWALNLVTGRFVKSMMDGYAGDTDIQRGSTPSITLGSCARED